MKRPTDSERYQYWRGVGIEAGLSIGMILKGANLDEFTDERIEEEKKPEILRTYETLKKRSNKKTTPRQK